MAKLRIVSAGVPSHPDAQTSLGARKQVLMHLIQTEVSESAWRVRAYWHDHANGWDVELKEVASPQPKRSW
jgi:hypothetical protein